MKKQASKQAKKASKLAKAENLKKEQAQFKSVERHPELVSGSNVITVKNAEGDPDTTAEIIIQNQINYTPKVSVIIPVYNVEHYLRECLDSVINQTLKEIEIICVDDGSTDNSLDILLEYAAKDKRMTIIRQQNLHAGVARNAGLAVARGEYLSFLDSDDFFELNMLEKVQMHIHKNQAEVCIFNCYFYDNKTKRRSSPTWTLKEEYIHSNIFSSKDIALNIFQLTNNWPWNKIFSKSYILKQKLFFQNTCHTNDTYFVALAIANAEKITVLNEKLLNYRTNVDKSLTTLDIRDMHPLDIDTVLYAIKNKIDSCFKRSFTFLCCNHLYWNITKNISLLSKDLLIDAISKHNFYDISPNLSAEYFEDSNIYEKYQFLLNLIPQGVKERNTATEKMTNVKVVSFDIFDTIIIRPYKNPSDLFKHMEYHFSEDGFYKKRIEAEKRARQNSKSEEITLDEIYSNLPDKYQKLKTEEQKFEIQIASVNPYIKDLIDFANKQGKEIVFISDMYLDESVIRDILKKFNLDKYKIFVSSKIKKTKASGNLYDFVLNYLKITPSDMLHIGDNIKSDKIIPEYKGIRTFIIQRYNDVNNKRYLSDFDSRELNKSVMLSLLKFNLYRSNNYWYNIGYCIGGPLANSFTNFIIEECSKNKLEELLFIARDGYVLRKVYETLDKDHLPTHYIYASRGLIYNVTNDRNIAFEYEQYLKNENIKASNLGCIDVTTINLSSQKFLSNLLPQKKILGIYWLANKLADSSIKYFNIFSRPHKVEALNFLIETLLSAPHGPVNKLENGIPIFDEQSEAENTRCLIYNQIAKGIIQFNQDIKNVFSSYRMKINPLNVVDLIYSFLQNQTTEDHERFEALSHTGNLFNNDHKPLSLYFDRFILIKISVIIPVYNVEKYLRECLDSVVNQTLKDIEIICVNDGSPDNSLAILKEYAAKDSRFVIIDQKNQGLSCSRNNAMKIAKGQYFVFLDSDDYLEPNALEVIYNNMAKKQLDMLSYSGINFDNKTKKEKINSYWGFKYLPKNFNYEKFNYKEAQEHNFITKMAVSSCLTAYKHSMIEKSKITFPEHLCFEDNLFFTKSLLNAKFCGIIKDKLYHRRIHELAITQNWDKHFADYLQITDMVIQYVKDENKQLFSIYKDSYLKACINIYNKFERNYQKKYTNQLKSLLKKYHYNPEVIINYPTNIFAPYLFFPYYLFKVVQMREKIYLKQNSSGLAHFLYHKVKTDSYTKTYICGIRVKKKPANIYEFIDKRLAKLSNNWEKKLNKIAETIEASDLNNRAEILEQLCQIPQQIAQNNMVNKKEITENHQKGLDDLLKNLKQYYVSRSKTDNYSLEFRTFADIAHCIRQNLKKIPNDVDLVVGVPRSGMIPAYIIALFMNKKCCSLDEFLSGSTGSNGNRKVNNEDIKKVLIVDDSVYNGTEMGRTREKLEPLTDKYHFIYATVYVKPDSEDKVDIWLERVPAPRVWQWNYLNHSIAKRACFDMDGVLCIDPTADENDDGKKYLEFIAQTKPLYIPTYEINAIVTSRLEKYREQTEKWLKDHGVKYKQLIMLDLPTAEERRKLGCHAKFKAEVYKKLSDTVLFVESEPNQAREIALLTGKTVICTSNDEAY